METIRIENLSFAYPKRLDNAISDIKLTINQLPIVALFLFVPIERHATAKVLDLHNTVVINGYVDLITVALFIFVNGIRKNFEK